MKEKLIRIDEKHNNTIIINSNIIVFNFRIEYAFKLNGKIVIILDIPLNTGNIDLQMDELKSRNVFCYSEAGALLWQIGSIKKLLPKASFAPINYYLVDDREGLVLMNILDQHIKINMNTGEIMDCEAVK